MIKSKLLLRSLDGACDAEAEAEGREIFIKYGTGRIEDDCQRSVGATESKVCSRPNRLGPRLILTLGTELRI